MANGTQSKRWPHWTSIVAWLLMAIAFAQPASGHELKPSTQSLDLTDSVGVVMDPHGDLTPERVMELAERGAISLQKEPRVPLLTLDPRYTIWLKFDVASEAGVSPDWRLVVGRPILDRLRLYTRSEDGRWIASPETGSMLPFSARSIPHTSFVFPVSIPGGRTTTFLLRVQDTGSSAIDATLWNPAALATADRTSYGIECVYFGLVGAMLLYNLMLAIVIRDRVYVLYLGLVACVGLGVLGHTGLAAEYLWSDATWWNSRSTYIFYNSGIVFLTAFARHFFVTRQRATAADWTLQAIGWVAFCGAVATALVSKRLGLTIVLLAGSTAPLVVLVLSLAGVVRRWPGAAYFFLGSLLLQAGILGAAVRYLTGLPAQVKPAESVAFGSAMEMILFALALANRINELAAAKEKATARMELYAMSINNSSDLIFFVDRATLKFVDANRAGLATLGFTREQLLLHGPSELGDRPSVETLAKSYDRLIARAPLTDTRETEFRRPDGSVIFVEVRRQAIFLDGRWLISLHARDVTERRRSAEELRRKVEELTRSNEELEQFAYVASHDLSEPLRMVGSFTQLIERRYGPMFDKEGREFLGFVLEGAQRMKQLLDDLLKYSRVSRPNAPDVEFALDEALDDALANLAHAIETSGATIERGPLPRIVGQRSGMTQMFQNLIGNAMKFRTQGTAPVVRVSSEDRGGEWVIAVSDNGIGIAPEYFPKIFVIFQRLHARERYEGTGIGLAICKKVAERHGGRIDVESTPGAGATFRLHLPKRQIGA